MMQQDQTRLLFTDLRRSPESKSSYQQETEENHQQQEVKWNPQLLIIEKEDQRSVVHLSDLVDDLVDETYVGEFLHELSQKQELKQVEKSQMTKLYFETSSLEQGPVVTNLDLNDHILKRVLPLLPMNRLFDPELAENFATQVELEP